MPFGQLRSLLKHAAAEVQTCMATPIKWNFCNRDFRGPEELLGFTTTNSKKQRVARFGATKLMLETICRRGNSTPPTTWIDIMFTTLPSTWYVLGGIHSKGSVILLFSRGYQFFGNGDRCPIYDWYVF